MPKKPGCHFIGKNDRRFMVESLRGDRRDKVRRAQSAQPTLAFADRSSHDQWCRRNPLHIAIFFGNYTAGERMTRRQ